MKKGVKTIIIGATLFITGAFLIPVAVILLLITRGDRPEQFIIPGEMTVEIEEAGRYYLWNDYQTIYKGKSYNRSELIPDSLEMTITNIDTGELKEIVGDTSTSSSSGSSSKNSIGYFEIGEPGQYKVRVIGESNERVFSFGEDSIVKFLVLIFAGGGVCLLIAFSGFGLIIYGIVKVVTKKNNG